MPKKTNDRESSYTRSMQGERAPPLLSEELIAKLQGAVNAARRKHDVKNRVSEEIKESASTAKDR
jgi:hypothetical protein